MRHKEDVCMSGFDYESRIVNIPDYPEPGVIFKDIMPLIGDAEALGSAVKEIADHFRDLGVTKVVVTQGVER